MNKEKVIFTINDVPKLKKNIEQMQKNYQQQIQELTNNWNELEECVESRLMSIPDDICTNEVEEARRTTKIAVYQVILGKMKEIKDGNDDYLLPTFKKKVDCERQEVGDKSE